VRTPGGTYRLVLVLSSCTGLTTGMSPSYCMNIASLCFSCSRSTNNLVEGGGRFLSLSWDTSCAIAEAVFLPPRKFLGLRTRGFAGNVDANWSTSTTGLATGREPLVSTNLKQATVNQTALVSFHLVCKKPCFPYLSQLGRLTMIQPSVLHHVIQKFSCATAQLHRRSSSSPDANTSSASSASSASSILLYTSRAARGLQERDCGS